MNIIEFIVPFIVSFILTLISLLVGYSLGKIERPLPPKIQDQLQEIFKKKISDSQVGAVSRPTQDQLDRFNNPKLAQEEQIMREELDRLNNQ